MSVRLIHVLVLCTLCLDGSVKAASSLEKAETFTGAWFAIQNPVAFKVRRGMPSSTMPDECDSAFFVSPDKRVEFYVFSPQWNGEPKDYVLMPRKEVLVSKKKQTVKTGTHTVVVTWVTVRATNKSYFRSWVDTEDVVNLTRHMFGIKYADSASLAKYSAQFAAFKKSLEQYSD